MNNKKTRIASIIGILAIVAAATVYFSYFKGTMTAFVSDTINPVEGEAEMHALVAAVGKLIVLPGGEDPTIATITDPEKLKNQPFFANAKIGYKVLIYPSARKAYLYDPSAKQLIEVAPLILGNPSDVIESSP